LSTKVTIIYDNEASKGFITGWGFAAIIETKGKAILFDTGWDGVALGKNMVQAGFDPKKIDYIVISHEHWDHLGGLDAMLHAGNKPMTIVPTAFSSKLKAEITRFGDLREVTKRQGFELFPDVQTTRQLYTSMEHIKEISLLVQTKKGLVVICGCSHPGLDTIIAEAEKIGHVHAVIGGFHGFAKLDRLKEIDAIYPCHCTKKKKEIISKFPNKSHKCYSGLKISFP
jgi:7,8-dihydropterin-6-yl-methyl-4-(beta-D-ribofuranosyl)aminobenzene 5'-phosphate synthase